MENSGLISVIVPVYNVEKYLSECIDSVLSQTYDNYEIILVDDGSTDNSGKICDEYAEKHDKITVIHKENSGPSKTRNVGLEISKGEYIYFLDSDDYLVSDAFDKLIKTAKKENADVVFFDAHSFADPEDAFDVKQGYLRKNDYKTDVGYSVLTELNKNKDFHCAIYLLLIRKSFLLKNEISFLKTAFCSEDMLFTYQLFCVAQRVAQCHEVLYYRRYRKSSIVTSKKTARHYLSCKAVYEEIKIFSENIGKLEDATAKAFVVRCAYNALDNYLKISTAEKEKYKNDYKSLKKIILKDNAYGDTALKMRCYGKIFWFVYKVFEKTVGRLFI